MNLKRTPCPKCGKKSLYHPALSGSDLRRMPDRDKGRAHCRSCGARFRIAREEKKE